MRALRHRREKAGQSLLEIVIYMAIVGIIAVSGALGYSVYLLDSNGSACTLQLNQLDIADKSYCATYGVTSATKLPNYTGDATTTRLEAFLDNKVVNGSLSSSNSLSCPAGGTYVAPTTLTGNIPGYPTCTIAAEPQFSGTRFHSITVL